MQKVICIILVAICCILLIMHNIVIIALRMAYNQVIFGLGLKKHNLEKNEKQGSAVNSHTLAIMSKLAYTNFNGMNITLPANNAQRFAAISNNANNPRILPILLDTWMDNNNKKDADLLGNRLSNNCKAEFNKIKNEWELVGQIDRPSISIIPRAYTFTVHHILKRIEEKITASVTVFQNINTSEIILAFRGTNSDQQLKFNDGTEWGGLRISPEAENSQFFTKGVQLLPYAHSSFEKSKVFLTGHSLGGFLALVAYAELLNKNYSTVSSVETFNGLGFRKIKNLYIPKAFGLLLSNKETITHHRIRTDIVSLIGKFPGSVVTYDSQYQWSQIEESHDLSNFLEKM